MCDNSFYDSAISYVFHRKEKREENKQKKNMERGKKKTRNRNKGTHGIVLSSF